VVSFTTPYLLYLWIEGWVGHRASLEVVVKIKKIPAPARN